MLQETITAFYLSFPWRRDGTACCVAEERAPTSVPAGVGGVHGSRSSLNNDHCIVTQLSGGRENITPLSEQGLHTDEKGLFGSTRISLEKVPSLLLINSNNIQFMFIECSESVKCQTAVGTGFFFADVLCLLLSGWAKPKGLDCFPMAVGRGLGSGSEELSAQSQATCAYAIIKVIDVSKTQPYFQVDWKKKIIQLSVSLRKCQLLQNSLTCSIYFFPGMNFYTKARKDTYPHFECAHTVKWLIECCESKGLHLASPALVCGSLFLPEGKHSTVDIFW